MKTKRIIIVALFIAFMFPLILNAQQTTSTSKYKGDWKPAKVTNDGNNVLDGVVFFRKAGECDTNKVILIKMVNVNKYTVKVQWQENSELTKSLIIPASGTIEGKCDSKITNSNESKLVILKPKEKDGNIKHNIILSLKVTEVK